MLRRKKDNGKIVIISSPSGGGKTTICLKLLRGNPRWKFSISYTTRQKRPGEKDGREYFFVDRAEFIRLRRQGFFAESARVHLHYYGTPRDPLDKVAHEGGVILLDVDVKGAASIKKKYPQALSIFIVPPSRAELRRRLRQRGTETKAQLKVRLKNALAEMEKYNRFDYIIKNENINEAVSAADHIIKSWKVGVTFFGRNKSKAYPVYR
jgi:guanylate kinase